MFTLALAIWGLTGALRLPIDAVPDITNNQVQIITYSPSLSPQEVEQLITFPVELNMANIPHIVEVRSISRFGLSVVTAVFTDNTDIYWARQQVSERLKTASEQIPKGLGIPELGPVSTGLSEIYQYTIHPKKGFENRYSAMDIRTIQDWMVRRQLLGTPGVADISSFGGYLKQYEVSIEPERLRNFGLTLTDVFNALQNNNENSGGAYIAKGSQAWYIRSEGMIKSLEDIGQIPLKMTESGLPVTVKDIGKIRFGHSIRYGALTRNADGESVGGIVLMLKGANSSEVISSVKDRMEQVRKTLPEGLEISVYLDRSELIQRAIDTVTQNLIEGALIVIFVLVLMLGNFRAGLVVASVIPLAMLFALGMMDLFGVSGNLMSLGAIDFGLIVDGAVIIVEAVMHRIAHSPHFRSTNRISQEQMDQEVRFSAGKMMNSAAFGQIIILIVYLPILALVGIEGKMFKPMAQTVSFAILGAFIFSLTYVPMIASLVLSKKQITKEGFSDKMMKRIHSVYQPSILWFLNHKTIVLGAALIGLLSSVWIFSQMGGVFIPNLDEGDFAVETRLMPGTSMDKTMDVTLKAAAILKQKFPEVKEVIGKIGTAEIPTDPMGFEACDLMVLLKPKKEWTTTDSKDELAERMQTALSEIPGVAFGFQQPIQMRFNELMTGARQDVAIKIYGEDLDELARQAEKMGALISKVDGLHDLYIENITGLPQMVASIKRDQLAVFGLHVDEVNRAIQAAFAGAIAGKVYEGEKRFDLVVRLDSINREQISDLKNLYIGTRDGSQIPLSKMADVEFKLGPNQIQRDDAKRRITVAFNVRGRDVESLVTEINQICDQKLKLPPGYYFTIGGQFKNLVEAKERLSIAVPLALALIFILLFFSFNSLKQSLLIFSAIPLSAIGGIWALWFRDMPFSISAGVGFIALFGVAVLNGIVLMSEFNSLKKDGVTNLEEIILKGTKVRIRPVLMTAMVASLGFMPMALSSNAGAEVQKPLATVVIGGLVSATLLTLLILPVLYWLSEKGFSTRIKTVASVILMGICLSPTAFGQRKTIRQSEAIDLAILNHPTLKSAQFHVEGMKKLKGSSTDLGKTSMVLQYGQYNAFENDNNLTLNQNIPFPTVFARQRDWYESQVQAAMLCGKVTENELKFQVKNEFQNLVFVKRKHRLLLSLDSLYRTIVKASALRFKTGETNLLETAIAESQLIEIQSQIRQNLGTGNIHQSRLQYWLQTTDSLEVVEEGFEIPVLPGELNGSQNPVVKLASQQAETSRKYILLEKARLLPDFNLGYFNQTLVGAVRKDGYVATMGNRFQGVIVGMQIPIWLKPQKARIQAAEAFSKASEMEVSTLKSKQIADLNAAKISFENALQNLKFLEENALPTALLIRQQALRNFEAGNIGILELTVAMKQSISSHELILQAQNQVKLELNHIQFLNGNL